MASSTLEILVAIKDQTAGAMNGIAKKFDDFNKSMQPSIEASQKFALGLGAVSAAAIAGGIMVVNAARESAQIHKQLEAVLKSTGEAAGITADKAIELAESLMKVTNVDDDAILSAENMLLTFTNIGKDIFPQVTESVLDMATAMNGGATPNAEQLRNTAMQLGKALNDPIQGMASLRRVGVSFSEDQIKVVKALVDTGKSAEAQKLIMAELNKEFGGSARAAVEPMQQLKNTFDDMSKAIGKELLPFVNDLAESLNNLISEHMIDWINKTKEIIEWLTQHKLVIVIFAGAILGALVPAIYAAVVAFAALLFTLAPFMIGGAIIAGLIYGIYKIVENWGIIKETFTGIWKWITEKIGLIGQVWSDGVNYLKKVTNEIFDAIKGKIEEVVKWIEDKIKALQDAYQKIVSFGRSIGAGVSNTFTSVSNFVTGKRAAGGPVGGGLSYLVGERGPEIFTPNSSGFITPNGGGSPINVYISGNTISSNLELDRLADRVGEAIMNKLRLNSKVAI